ncbi:hypothetical protein OH492_14870 [Vibrio chagasii]|nr:hypothetical protein [Vibrio chagasii]
MKTGNESQLNVLQDVRRDGKIEKHAWLRKNDHYTWNIFVTQSVEAGDDYLMVVGLKHLKKQAQWHYIAVDPMSWATQSTIIKTRYNNLGYVECPDFFEIDNQSVMLFSPQGVSSETHTTSKISILWLTFWVDRLNLDTGGIGKTIKILPSQDYGFDFYAPQTYLDDKGRRILIAWVIRSEIDTPSNAHQWRHVVVTIANFKSKMAILSVCFYLN